MRLSKNVAKFLHAFAEKNNLSLAKIQEITEVSLNTIYIYSRGEGNPSCSTIECIAMRLKVAPEFIMLGVYDPDSKEISVLLVDTIQGMAGLTPGERRKFLKLLLEEALKLWDEE